MRILIFFFLCLSVQADFIWLEGERANKSSVVKLLVAQPTLIKRPVIEVNKEIIVGFSEEIYQNTF